MKDPDKLIHAFRTPFGLPADKSTPAACGAVLTDKYDWPKETRPVCAKCAKLVRAAKR